jgi:integrase
VDNERLPSNPAARVVIDVKAKAAEKIRSFSVDEAVLVLKAARENRNPIMRWVPWLCAYTGARVAEICQLRVEDVVSLDGIRCFRITPEAGPLKTSNSERAIPVHSALIDEGFLTFVSGVGKGPLFPGLPLDQFGSRGGNGTKVLGRWVRSLGIEDKRISPNHSWRHRLKTLARRHGLATDIVDALVGHRKRIVADGYGEFPIVALSRELEKVPAIELS